MSPGSFRERIPGINSWLLAALFFLIPIKVAPAYVLTAVMLVLWLVEGRHAEKGQALRSHPPGWIFHGFFWVMAASLLWTEHWDEGRRNVLRYTFVALAPMFFWVARREHRSRYVLAFLAGLPFKNVVDIVANNQERLLRCPGIVDALGSNPMTGRSVIDRILSFIGLGIGPPDASWGSMAQEGYKVYRVFPLLIIIPSVAIATLILCANFIADGLRDALDPRTRET